MKVVSYVLSLRPPHFSQRANDTDPLLDESGLELRISFGAMVRPVLPGGNPWTGRPWFVIRVPLPWIPWPFVTLRMGRFCCYLGCKVAGFGNDWPWRRIGEYGHFLTPTARTSMRCHLEAD